MTTEEFQKISETLCGITNLSWTESDSYLRRLEKAEGYPAALDSLSALYGQHQDRFMEFATQALKNCCRGIVFLWYTSELIPLAETGDVALPSTRFTGSQQEYYESLIWKVIRAHPPGLSGGYFGHWKYEPEN